MQQLQAAREAAEKAMMVAPVAKVGDQDKAAVEDLELPLDPDKGKLPALPRLGELRVPASAYANLLMVDEFLTTFHDCIGFKGKRVSHR